MNFLEFARLPQSERPTRVTHAIPIDRLSSRRRGGPPIGLRREPRSRVWPRQATVAAFSRNIRPMMASFRTTRRMSFNSIAGLPGRMHGVPLEANPVPPRSSNPCGRHLRVPPLLQRIPRRALSAGVVGFRPRRFRRASPSSRSFGVPGSRPKPPLMKPIPIVRARAQKEPIDQSPIPDLRSGRGLLWSVFGKGRSKPSPAARKCPALVMKGIPPSRHGVCFPYSSVDSPEWVAHVHASSHHPYCR